MNPYTTHQARYFAEQISLRRADSSVDRLVSAMSGSRVDLNPHQVEAALFALQSPLSNGAILADEVGLGKTIEAGLVMAQFWSERKRRILLIAPASLRMQWRDELHNKFFIDSLILDSSVYNAARKKGIANPFEVSNEVVICSYQFASRRSEDLSRVAWDLVVMDEAHKMRNVYKPDNVTANSLREALRGRRKLLLTATPLQNNLMELFGLTSMVDEHVFGDARTFRDMFVSGRSAELAEQELKSRLASVCRRTLRRQVLEYVKYTERRALLQHYEPTEEEELLYQLISAYLQRPQLYALPRGQRTLMTLVMRKLLASSSFAICGTLESLCERLRSMLAEDAAPAPADMDDFDTLSEYEEEESEAPLADFPREDVQAELEELERYVALARSISLNAKGENLLLALRQGFESMELQGGQQKAVIFTESRRTQQYLFELLSRNGYEDKIVFLNGVNDDAVSRKLYADWKKRHKKDGLISGSRQADMKAAVVEAFRNEACILIGTESASEGINLQFCSIVVNYDLPWNPQRVEQRIGRCHRYGQKNDVVVINFLNSHNAADQRVYELLDQKFRLFSGVFGASDEVLGSLESGMDFEKRIAAIYQECKTQEEIQRGFDKLQEEFAEQINERTLQARQSILEHFDESVAQTLVHCKQNAIACLGRYAQWLYYFFLSQGGERVEVLDGGKRLSYTDENGKSTVYNLDWQDAESRGERFLRRDEELVGNWLTSVQETALSPVHIRFDNTNSERKHSFFDAHPGLRGVISIVKLAYSGAADQDKLIIACRTEDGTELDEGLINRLLELPGVQTGAFAGQPDGLEEQSRLKIAEVERDIAENNKRFYLAECAKLNAYSEDLKNGLEHQLRELDKEIKQMKRDAKMLESAATLEELVAVQGRIRKQETRRNEMRRTLYERQDAIELENDRLQAEVARRLKGHMEHKPVMTFSFELV